MGQIVRRKRKGRSSNSDRARVNSSAAPPSPVDRRRSRRRRNVRYNFDIDDYVDDDEFDDDDEDEEVGRREKKLRLLLYDEDDSRSNRRVTHAPTSSSSSEDDYDEDDDFKYSKKRRVNGGGDVYDEDNEIQEIRGRKLEEEEDDDDFNNEEEEEEAPGGSDFDCGAASDSQKEVPLPDKKTLELILDKLQKKDIYGVYSEPVDPDELPDYHDVIKHPMDFSTVRKKLSKGAYLTLKEFERDVFLICTNAMQYNAPDTIYYKQASSIQEQAKLRFQRLRTNSDRSETELKPERKVITPSFSQPKKQLKKPVGRPVHNPVISETLSGSNGANKRIEEFPNVSSPVRPNNSENEMLIPENSSLPDNSLDKDQELVVPGKSCISKLGRTPVVDENRRATYDKSIETEVPESSSIFSIFEGESKQFIPVGLHVDHSYARSLARFAATLGSVAWKVASQTIEQALPKGVKYGRGWVGEYEPLPTPVVLMPGDHQANFLSLFKVKEASRSTHKSSRTFKESVAQQSSKEAIKDPPRPPFFSNLVNQNSFKKQGDDEPPQVELNHPPTRHPVLNGSDIRSPRPVSRNGNLVSLPSFKHPNIENDGFAPGRPKKEQQGLSDPVQMMKMLAAEKGQNQNGFGFSSKREDSNNGASTIHPHFPIKVQQQEVYSNGSNNVGLTPAHAWMSLGGTRTGTGTGTGTKTGNTVDCLYNLQQTQVSRFRGEFGVHYNQPVQMTNEGHLGFSQRVQVQPGWQGVPYQMQQQMRPIKQQESRPPDLNIGYQSPARQSTSMLVDSQQPDLALQL